MGDKAIGELEVAAAMAERGQLTNEEHEGAETGMSADRGGLPGADQSQDVAAELGDEAQAMQLREAWRAKKAAAAAAEAAKATETDEQRHERESQEAAEAAAVAEIDAAQRVVMAEAVRNAQVEAEAAGRTLTPQEIAEVKIGVIRTRISQRLQGALGSTKQ
jgi:hypothetical protein